MLQAQRAADGCVLQADAAAFAAFEGGQGSLKTPMLSPLTFDLFAPRRLL